MTDLPTSGRDATKGSDPVEVHINGASTVIDGHGSLLDALRAMRPRLVSVKDGCAPQGQCGCCTVLVNGQPRVACVTPARRVAGKSITTLEGLPASERDVWVDAFTECGASQCGFCTPGIIVRLAARAREERRGSIHNALAAHLCRCTGWQTITEAAELVESAVSISPAASSLASRDLLVASRRAEIEGRVPQRVGAAVARGEGGFAIDSVPDDARYAVPDGDGGWAVAETLAAARALTNKVQGRRSTLSAGAPIALPEGDWAVTLQTSWVEPAYLEPDVSWCRADGEPASSVANGGAFGAKQQLLSENAARSLSRTEGATVAVVLAREDTVRLGAKRPPMAAGIGSDGTGVVRVARTPGIARAIAAVAPGLEVIEIDVDGPRTSAAIRGSGWVEAAVLVAAATGAREVRSPDGAVARAEITTDGTIHVFVNCGDLLDPVVLRSYLIGAAHMAFSWVTSEQLTVADDGSVQDLTIRSFGVVKAGAMPAIEVTIEPSESPPVNGSDAAFAAVALAVWRSRDLSPVWPCG